MKDLKELIEIASHCVHSGAQLIVEGGYVIAVARKLENGKEEITISPVMDDAESARQYSQILEKESIRRNRPDVMSLGVFKLEKVDKV